MGAHCGAFGECRHRYLVAAPAVRLGAIVFLPGVASCRLAPPVFRLADDQRAQLRNTTPPRPLSSVLL